jgi:hypothetical protein
MTKAARKLSEKVVICERTGCHIWTGPRDRNGYGKISLSKRSSISAHRAAWQLASGGIPPGMFVCHTCDNPPCCNPAHLFLGTPLDNARDRDRKGRTSRHHARPPIQLGGRNSQAKLTLTQAQEIYDRGKAGEKGADLAREFGIRQSGASQIINGRTWPEVSRPS